MALAYQKMYSMDSSLTIQHIGIVVENVHKAIDFYRKFIDEDVKYYFQDIGSQKVRVCMVTDRTGHHIEFIEPLELSSPISRCIREGGGLHHIAFEVDEIEVFLQEKKAILRSIFKPVQGIDGKLMTFAVIKDASIGLPFIEIIEKKSRKEKR